MVEGKKQHRSKVLGSYVILRQGEAADQMTWPHPGDPQELQHRLRYGPPLSEAEQRVVASYMEAYSYLINLPRRTRDERVAEIRHAVTQPRAQEGDRG